MPSSERISAASVVAELAQLGLDPGARSRPRPRPAPGGVRADSRRGPRSIALVDVGHVEDRLGGQREQPALASRRRRPGPAPQRTGRPGAERLDDPLEPLALGDRLLVAGAGLLGHPSRARRSACSRSAASSSVSISSRSRDRVRRAPSGWATAPAPWRADHVADRVGLANRGQEAVAEALALRRRRGPARRCRGTRSSRGRPRGEPRPPRRPGRAARRGPRPRRRWGRWS